MHGLKDSYDCLTDWIGDARKGGYTIPPEVEEAARTLYEGATTDSLTGLRTPTAAREYVDNREGKEGNAFILYDIDSFGEINNRLGKPAGDKVLRRVGRILRSGLRSGDIHGCRYSGGADELILYLPKTDKEGAKIVDERVRSYMEQWKEKAAKALERVGKEQSVINHVRSINLSGSIVMQGPNDSFDDLFAAADRKLKGVKEFGKGYTTS